MRLITLLLCLSMQIATAQADDEPTDFSDPDLEEDLEWEDDGTRPDSDASDPDADPTWDDDEDELPIDLGEDPLEDVGLRDGPSEGPALDDDPEWDIDRPEDAGLGEDEPPTNLRSRPAVRPSAVGKMPLADNYPLSVIDADLEAVVIELPVLISQRRADLSSEFWLIGEVYLDGAKVSESRALVTAAGAAELSPSFVWIKAQAPIAESSGSVEVRVSKQEVGGANHPLFTRKAAY